jgi:hypothetical protein
MIRQESFGLAITLLEPFLSNRPFDVANVDHQEILKVVFRFVRFRLSAVLRSLFGERCRSEFFRQRLFRRNLLQHCFFLTNCGERFWLVELSQEVFAVDAGCLPASGRFVESVIAGNNQDLSGAAMSLQDQFDFSIGVSPLA